MDNISDPTSESEEIARWVMTFANVIIFALCMMIGGLTSLIGGIGIMLVLHDLANGGIVWELCVRVLSHQLTDAQMALVKYHWSTLDAGERRNLYTQSTRRELVVLRRYINIMDYAPEAPGAKDRPLMTRLFEHARAHRAITIGTTVVLALMALTATGLYVFHERKVDEVFGSEENRANRVALYAANEAFAEASTRLKIAEARGVNALARMAPEQRAQCEMEASVQRAEWSAMAQRQAAEASEERAAAVESATCAGNDEQGHRDRLASDGSE